MLGSARLLLANAGDARGLSFTGRSSSATGISIVHALHPNSQPLADCVVN
jgi:hypothetical protein